MKDITTEEAVEIVKKMHSSVYVLGKQHDALGEVLNELNKKDKIIDAMAEVIEECRQNDCLESEDVDLSQIAGVKAIKQYFEKEVKDE